MSIFRKKMTLLKTVKNNTPETIAFFALLGVFVLLALKVNPLFSLIITAFCALIVVRLFFGKLKLKPGDVVLFWGLPGSGKTMFQNSVCYYNKRKNKMFIVGNEEFYETSNIVDACLPRDAFGFFACPVNSVIATDEASLNGWDNRDWQRNFTPASLSYWKKIRHYGNCAVLTNQGFGELDVKIRDSLCSCVYYCVNKGRYSKAVRMDKTVTFSEVTGLPQEGYSMPSIWQRLIDPSCVLYVWHKNAGKLYRSLNPDDLPPLKDLKNYLPVYNKKGIDHWDLKPFFDDKKGLDEFDSSSFFEEEKSEG